MVHRRAGGNRRYHYPPDDQADLAGKRKMIKLSIVIPCYNSADTIADLLESLACQAWSEPWEVIVSDNGSTDATLTIAEQYNNRFSYFKVVDASRKRGAAHARNVGASFARGEALAFVDADDVVTSGWVAAIGEALSVHDFVASRFDGQPLNAAWVFEGCRLGQQKGVQPFTYPNYLPHAGCSGLGVKRSLHESIGGFDESLPVLEDTDYCWRIQLKGVSLNFSSDAVVNVRLRESILGIYRQISRWGEYSTLLYKRYRVLGMPKLSWKNMVSAWIRVIKILPYGYSKRGRAHLARSLGYRVGRLKGCVKNRVFAP
jgi:glycosyltransferase involved in cell wall biosynthesis